MAGSRRKGSGFLKSTATSLNKKTADIAVIELMSFNLYKNKKIMISENNEKKMLNCKERFYNELPEYNNICCIVVNDYDIGKGSVLVISIMRG
ncbi:hypothetical protein [Peribacillus frigoritolerans]|uniref:hypothetical protein n=1 Tax=Peribacillus frigoritolerans TaxID=450367 RepID=UPI00222F51B2|nr:hypothetical protein [Peribacillus frigoritolerans]UZD46444.1 hypothetical protein OMJ04_23195 [Peribacillus frigoritolerans]WHX61494.1 hypothetical protein QNH33_23360 [Peribacillus frigoritolerans]